MKITIKHNKSKLYHAGPIPTGATLIGDIAQPGRSANGALIYFSETNRFARLNAGTVAALPQAETFAALVRAWREENALTQAAAAKKIGVSVPTLSRWERAERTPNAPTIKFFIGDLTSKKTTI